MARSVSAPDRCERLVRLDAPVSSARFVDASRATLLEKLDVRTIGQLLFHVPFRYLDLTSVATLRDVPPGSEATVVGRVHEVKVKRPRPRLAITEVAIVDGTGVLLGVWFNQPWVSQRFVPGERVAFAGRIELEYGLKQIKTPFFERLPNEDDDTSGRVVPVHRSTEGLSTGWLRRLIAAAVDDHSDLPDHIPARLRILRDLLPLSSAIRSVHFPSTSTDAEHARRRLAYDELLGLQTYMALRRHAHTVDRVGMAHVIDGQALSTLRDTIPWTLTADQARCVDEILADMARPHPMNRLLMGDVGTGKTLVAAHALAAVADTGTQAAMMAPTEILAQQYAEKIGPLLDAADIPWSLLTGSTPAAERDATIDGIGSGAVAVAFGTHALLEERVVFARLGLAIVDEQHRFGVGQRLGLRGKGVAADLLVMTATPIPRSLALTLYGDLATSYLRTRPHATAGVSTHHVKPHQAHTAHSAVRAAVAAGHQAYVVCALVDESDTAQAKAATREVERLRNQVFPDLRVGLLTGRMRPAEKAEAMRAFRNGDIDVLVSTTVIEVGVDVPGATVMIIEDADRFGLAQLHQLRGRVGRGSVPGDVWLVAEPRTVEGRDRIAALLESADGFEIAERDLELRGAGQLLGDRQHGLPDLVVANLIRDIDLVEAARVDAFDIVTADPDLSNPDHRPLRLEVMHRFAGAWEWVSSG